MNKRKVPIDKEKAKQISKLFSKANNNAERKRIQVMVSYLNWLNYKKIIESWIANNTCIKITIERYIENENNFFKTNRTWRQYSNERDIITNEIEKIIKEESKKWHLIDIHTLRDIYNRRNKKWKILKYKQVWYVVRKRLKLKYQKPYIKDKRRPIDAESILRSRIEEGYKKVLEKEWFEENRLKNKKIWNWFNIT